MIGHDASPQTTELVQVTSLNHHSYAWAASEGNFPFRSQNSQSPSKQVTSLICDLVSGDSLRLAAIIRTIVAPFALLWFRDEMVRHTQAFVQLPCPRHFRSSPQTDATLESRTRSQGEQCLSEPILENIAHQTRPSRD